MVHVIGVAMSGMASAPPDVEYTTYIYICFLYIFIYNTLYCIIEEATEACGIIKETKEIEETKEKG